MKVEKKKAFTYLAMLFVASVISGVAAQAAELVFHPIVSASSGKQMDGYRFKLIIMNNSATDEEGGLIETEVLGNQSLSVEVKDSWKGNWRLVPSTKEDSRFTVVPAKMDGFFSGANGTQIFERHFFVVPRS